MLVAPRTRHAVIFAALSLLAKASRVEGQDRYADPAGRFTVPIPLGWETSTPRPDAVTISNGVGQVTIILPGDGHSEEVLAQYVGQYAIQWSGFKEVREGSITLGGRDGRYLLASGRTPNGVASFVKVATIDAGEGLLVLLSSGPQEGFSSLRPTLEGIEGGIVLGSGRIHSSQTIGSATTQPGSARAFLGVGTRSVDSTEVSALGLPSHSGVVVGQIYPNGPADVAGLSAGDVITSVDGQTIANPDDLTEVIGRHTAGAIVTLTVYSRGRSGEIRVALGTAPIR